MQASLLFNSLLNGFISLALFLYLPDGAALLRVCKKWTRNIIPRILNEVTTVYLHESEMPLTHTRRLVETFAALNPGRSWDQVTVSLPLLLLLLFIIPDPRR